MMLTNKAFVQPQALKRPVDAEQRRSAVPASRMTIVLGLVAMTVLGAALLYVAQKTQLMTLSYQRDALQTQVQRAAIEHDYLQVKMVEADSLDRVERLAVAELGMVRPARQQYVVLDQMLVDVPPVDADDMATDRGLIAVAVDWVTRHWPRIGTAQAGGNPR